jgi:hypothetical protein
MAADDEVTWVVGRAKELGVLTEQLASIDATVEESWPAGPNAGIVALVRSAPTDADTVVGALGPGTLQFSDETGAREAAEEMARDDT